MSKIFIEESTLTAIGDAIRGKEGTTELVPVTDMATRITAIQSGSDPVIESLEITSNGTYTATECDGYSPITVNVPQDGAPTADELTLTGNCYWTFANGGQWDWFIKKYGNQITTRDINGLNRTFGNCSTLTEIPFEINCQAGTKIECGNLFDGCNSLTTIPKFNNCKIGSRPSMFAYCSSIVEFPEDMAEWFDWSAVDNATGPYDVTENAILQDCTSLRKVPYEFLKHQNPYARHAGSVLSSGFDGCYSLDEVSDFPILPSKTDWTSNGLSNTLSGCKRLRKFTFALNPETNAPYVVRWKNQTLDFTTAGYGVGDWDLQSMVGFTEETRVYNDATYEALKNHPDMHTQDYFYSRYNHDSAVETINSLPDTSAYGTNTIKFLGQAGCNTDGGAISNLTEEEIAVATAKGWTVTIS